MTARELYDMLSQRNEEDTPLRVYFFNEDGEPIATEVGEDNISVYGDAVVIDNRW